LHPPSKPKAEAERAVKPNTEDRQVTLTPSILVVNGEVPANSVQELIALARAEPGQRLSEEGEEDRG
jgi:tripartite-type tricarboxylate transporter receptor subunit TctC